MKPLHAARLVVVTLAIGLGASWTAARADQAEYDQVCARDTEARLARGVTTPSPLCNIEARQGADNEELSGHSGSSTEPDQRNEQTRDDLRAALPADEDEAARLSAQKLCELNRLARAQRGLSEDPAICAIASGEVSIPEHATPETRTMLERSVRAAGQSTSALDTLLARASDDYFYCKVLLCMGAPRGPRSVAQCVPVIERFRRMLRANVDIPACPMTGFDRGGELAFVGEVGNQGRTEVAPNGGDDSRDATSVVGDAGRRAHQEFGIACNDARTMLDQMGPSAGVAAGHSASDWMRRGYTHTAFADYDSQPQWWKDGHSRYAGAWNRILPWFVAYEGSGNEAGAAQVQIGRMSISYLSRSQRSWHVLDSDTPWGGSRCPQGSNYHECPEENGRAGPDGYGMFSVGAGTNVHGWFEMMTLPDPADVQAFTVTVEARLIGRNAGTAQMLMNVGADFYPPVPLFNGVNPGAAASGMQRLGPGWSSVSMVTLSDLIEGNGRGVSVADLRRNPPPCAGP